MARTAQSGGCAGSCWPRASAACACVQRRPRRWPQLGACCTSLLRELYICLYHWRLLLTLMFLYRLASPALASMYLPEVQALLLDGQLEAVPTGEADLLAVPSCLLNIPISLLKSLHAWPQPPVCHALLITEYIPPWPWTVNPGVMSWRQDAVPGAADYRAAVGCLGQPTAEALQATQLAPRIMALCAVHSLVAGGNATASEQRAGCASRLRPCEFAVLGDQGCKNSHQQLPCLSATFAWQERLILVPRQAF